DNTFGVALIGFFAAWIIVTRLYILIQFRWIGADTFYVLTAGQLIRKAGSLSFRNTRFSVSEDFDYPPLAPFLASRVGPQHLWWIQIAGPAADIATGFVLTAFALWWQGPLAAGVALMVYATTPGAF